MPLTEWPSCKMDKTVRRQMGNMRSHHIWTRYGLGRVLTNGLQDHFVHRATLARRKNTTRIQVLLVRSAQSPSPSLGGYHQRME
jgi:hypothetical protein